MCSGTISEHIDYLASAGELLSLKCTRAQSGLSYVGDPLPDNYGRIFQRAMYCMRPTTGGKWRPSIHMPRWASRILLEVTDVRVERLQEIQYRDSTREGFGNVPEFQYAWDTYSKIQWATNPWVWVIGFRRVKT